MQSIRLDQGAFQLQRAEQLLERGPLAGFVGVVGLLGQGDTEGPGIDREPERQTGGSRPRSPQLNL